MRPQPCNVRLHCPGYLFTCMPSYLQDQELPGAGTGPFMPVTSVWQRPCPGLAATLQPYPGLLTPAFGTVWSSIPGCFTFVPSMLVPSRTGGKRPLDMHRVCGLISGRGQGDREKKGPEGSEVGAGSNWEVLCCESGRPRPCAGHHPTKSSARLLQSWGYTPTLESPSSKQQKPHSHPGQGGSEPCPLLTLLLWLTQAWQ